MADQGVPTRTLRLTPAPSARPENDDLLSTELDAIITIGRALSHIPDPETRTRVLRWAIERFGIDITPAPEPGGDLELPSNLMPAQPEKPELSAETLNLDGISDLFPPAEEHESTGERDFEPPHSRERKPKATAGERLRDALHWMGI